LSEVGEERLLAGVSRLLPAGRRVVAGIGDDVAVVVAPGGGDLLLLKTDCMVEQVHFTPETAAQNVGWKAMMRTLSDFAAVSGIPEFALVTLVIERTRELRWVTKLYRGLARAAARFDVSIVGGETSATEGPTVIAVSVAGRVEKNRWVSRTGGRSGDDLFVTGRLGRSVAGKHLRFTARIEESRWLTRHFPIHAMMDLSDGLGADLPRLGRSSGLGFRLDRAALPLARGASVENAISDGEDYELLFAASPGICGRLQRRWARKFPKVDLTRIGSLVSASEVVHDGSGSDRELRGGYIHFQ
jgi:thiamine-monophosphate kinase